MQGVYFRESTRREAERLGLTGYAHNLADGSVEVLACGGEDAIEQLEKWLHDGPPLAKVERITVITVDVPPTASFETGWA